MDVVNNEMPLMGNFIIRKSILSHKTYDREVNNVQKMIATLLIDTNNKKNILSKSAKKRLRKKRQASAKNIEKSLSNGIAQKIEASVRQVRQRGSLNPLQSIKQCKNNTKTNEFDEQKYKNTDPQHSIYSFIVSGNSKELSTEDIMLLLGLQNKFLTNQWTVKQRQNINKNKSMITVGIDPNSESLLKNNNHQAALLRSTIVFKKKNKETTANNSKPAESRTNKLHASKQPEDKPFSWLGKWQTFTTSLNRMH